MDANRGRIGWTIDVLDHGYVKLVDFMGSDAKIVEAARISTGRGFVSWEPYARCTRCDLVYVSGRDLRPDRCTVGGGAHDWQAFPRGDVGILDYLYRMEHTTPFEMCELVIDVMVPMDHWRQWIRNRTASVNEYSTRYAEAIDVVAKTKPTAWRTQGTTNRQGSGAFLPEDVGVMLSQHEIALHDMARAVYEERLAAGVAKEQARKDLPLSNYTAARWKIDLMNLLKHFLAKRLHPHAQAEIRSYAGAVAEITKALWPRTYELFEEYDLHGARLSCTEKMALADLVGRQADITIHASLVNMLGDAGATALIKKLGK